MTPDDPRHGSTRGYSAGCREACCKRAHALDVKLSRLRKVEGRPRAIPVQGTQRRIQALMAMGWTSQDIADAAGLCHRAKVTSILNGQKGRPAVWVTQSTRDRIAAVYDTLSMRLPDMTRGRQRTRTIAARKGYAPPLAWDDIDTDPAPMGVRHRELVQRHDHHTWEDHDELQAQGYTRAQIAHRLGMTVDALEKSLARRRKEDAA